MKLATFRYMNDAWSRPFPDLDSERTMVLAFAAPSFVARPDLLVELAAAYPRERGREDRTFATATPPRIVTMAETATSSSSVYPLADAYRGHRRRRPRLSCDVGPTPFLAPPP